MDIEEVIRLLRAGDWEGAHGIVQDDESTLAAWAHGIVHMLEGDMANAGYWFRRAGRTLPETASKRRWTIPTAFGDGHAPQLAETAAEMVKSKSMSAKNAWGKSTGYASTLIDQGMEATRAQQLENWQNQQEVKRARQQQRYMTEEFDQSAGDEDWRNLSNYAGERVDENDLDEQLGAVTPGEKILHHFELTSRLNRAEVAEFDLTVRFGCAPRSWVSGRTTRPFWRQIRMELHNLISFLKIRRPASQECRPLPPMYWPMPKAEPTMWITTGC